MAYIVKDTNPQYGGQCYFVGTRKIKDPRGRDCEAADFGDREHAKKFSSRSDASSFVSHMNKIAGRQQFVVEELSIYGQQYGQRRTNGFAGYGTLPQEQPSVHGGFRWDDGDGYNGF
jgi:hypothetical protein